MLSLHTGLMAKMLKAERIVWDLLGCWREIPSAGWWDIPPPRRLVAFYLYTGPNHLINFSFYTHSFQYKQEHIKAPFTPNGPSLLFHLGSHQNFQDRKMPCLYKHDVLLLSIVSDGQGEASVDELEAQLFHYDYLA